MFFKQIFDEKLAQYAYVIGCQRSGEAVVIDPMRDVDRYHEIARQNGLKIVAAADTHIHADYLSGLRELAEQDIHVYASDEGGEDWRYEWLIGSSYSHQLLVDGDEFRLGNIIFKAVHSPGHTPEHLSYLVSDGAATDEPMGILSGDFIFVGDVGRPDLLETAAGQQGVMEHSAKVLFQSVEQFKTLPGYLQVWPGHGAGSACGKALGAVPVSTVGYELQFNASIQASKDEKTFVEFILEGQPEPPLYFARMKRDNKSGPKILGTLPRPEKMTASQAVAKSLGDDAVVLDTRERDVFMKGHLKGSLLIPLDKQFNTLAGSFVREGQEIYLVIEEDRVEEAVTDLIRIGLDNIAGFVPPADVNTYSDQVATDAVDFKAVDRLLDQGGYQILDVRKKSEYDLGHHPDAIHIAHTRLLEHLKEIPIDKPLLVHCKSGSRASVSAALLEANGFSVKFVKDSVEPWLEKNGFMAT